MFTEETQAQRLDSCTRSSPSGVPYLAWWLMPGTLALRRLSTIAANLGHRISKEITKQNRNRFKFIVDSSFFFFALQGKPPTKKAKVLHKAAWSAKIGAFLHAQGTGQLADGTPTGQDGETESRDGRLGWRWPAGKLGIQVYSELSPPAGFCGNDRRHSFEWLYCLPPPAHRDQESATLLLLVSVLMVSLSLVQSKARVCAAGGKGSQVSRHSDR